LEQGVPIGDNMPSEIGKWNVLEVDSDFVTMSVKCYCCHHWTILRIPTEELKKEVNLERVEKQAEKEVSDFIEKVKGG
jgi:hypothetical protein